MSEENKPSIWMPIQEAIALQKWYEERTQEEIRRHSYFMWNNFSMDGYEEFLEQERALGHVQD